MKKAKINYLTWDFIVFILLLVAAVTVMMINESEAIKYIAIVVIFCVAFAYFGISTYIKEKAFYIAAKVLTNCSEKLEKYINSVSIPTVITSPKGKICWHNPAFLMLANTHTTGKNIFKVLGELNKPTKDKKIKIYGKIYYRETVETEEGGKKYVIYRFIAVDSAYEPSDFGKKVQACVLRIQIDNYEDVLRSSNQSEHSEIRSAIERIINTHTTSVRGFYEQYDKDKYILVMERRYIANFMQNKFIILEEVRKIKSKITQVNPTLSIGTGVGKTTSIADINSQKALDLALARGGDQAVIKDDEEYKFYGGVQNVLERRSKVKVRLFSNALKNLMEQCGKIYIMGHTIPDLDSMGAALGLLACVRGIEKEAYIVIDKTNDSIENLLEEMAKDSEYNDVLISPQDALARMEGHCLLIVVDTQIANFTISPALVAKANNIVVIDHHLRGTNHIENATLLLHEPSASSTSEMVTEIIQYFGDNVKPKFLEIETLLSGIAIDTKGFSYNTGVRTFEAASFLRQRGANTTSIKHLFQDDLVSYAARASIVQNAEVYKNGIAISVCPPDVKSPQLISAQAADALISIKGIEASFVLCKHETTVMISGRSLGSISAHRILEKMGGGGHATIAGAQFRDADIEFIKEKLKLAIESYIKEK